MGVDNIPLGPSEDKDHTHKFTGLPDQHACCKSLRYTILTKSLGKSTF